ncbi:hypothetical protein OHA98_14035 [Streptomyces sp. NBC_00654]|uniref:hypothetical protein n=1 Tax=Streptomyces sp. NBC_00654 TaxID=2975799 RepID=UPI0022528658|nr:hypothetical protein [Streptomyces sp. NBC_00654]MCX4965941.1 hypothetical protein [Streptomyces sp. NBC_00654]
MLKKTRIITAVGAAAAAVALATPSAIAGPSAAWNITPTGNFTGTAGVTTLTDNVGNVIQCATASANGNVPSSSVAGPVLANITSASFNAPCTGPFGSTWTVTAATPWTINGNTPGGYTAGSGTNGTGKTTGWVGGISATVTGSSVLGPCTFKVTGTVDGVYNNPSAGGSNGTLAVAPAATSPRVLTIGSKVGGGCGIVGATATFKGTYNVVSAAGGSPVITYS